MRELFQHRDSEQDEINAMRFSHFLTLLIGVAIVYILLFGGPK